MGKGIVFFVPFIALPVFCRAQDCCGPGGGGVSVPDIAAAAETGDYVYRLKNVRHYAYSARRPGFTAGLEGGGIRDSGEDGGREHSR
jgi:hypothetical protein